MSNDEIRVRYVSAEGLGLDVNTSVGLGKNGSVHPVATIDDEGNTVVVNFFTKSGEALPRSYYELLVKNEEQVLSGLSGEARILMAARMAEIKKYLELTRAA